MYHGRREQGKGPGGAGGGGVQPLPFLTKRSRKMGNFKLEITNFPLICDRKGPDLFTLAPPPREKVSPTSPYLYCYRLENFQQ